MSTLFVYVVLLYVAVFGALALKEELCNWWKPWQHKNNKEIIVNIRQWNVKCLFIPWGV